MKSFAARLVAWHNRAGRKDLPWQRTRDSYRIWLSEIMLQQTQVATVVPYYQRFVTAFPDVASLGAAPIGRVLELWSGLGYYRRAHLLHRTAQAIVREPGVARREGCIAELPARRPGKALPQRAITVLLLERQGEVLLERRPAIGIWAGLWSLPELSMGADVVAHCRKRFAAQVALRPTLPAI